MKQLVRTGIIILAVFVLVVLGAKLWGIDSFKGGLPWVNPSKDTQTAEMTHRTAESTSVVAWTKLPVQAQQTYRLIEQGGPFEHRQDGAVFGNHEGRLPASKRGYYREYTVKTPGLRHRGARRIVCGGQVLSRPHICYYTQDHYASFRKIVEAPHPTN